MHTHPKSWIEPAELGLHRREYRPNHAFAGDYINAEHAAYAELPVDGLCIRAAIPGWLQPADALKLYELAYFCRGEILELGTYRGLSTSILLAATAASGRLNPLTTVDRSRWHHLWAAWHLRRLRRAHLRFRTGDATRFLDEYIAAGRRFAFIFIDHSHRFEPMAETCKRLAQVSEPGGLCLFHDYNDARNAAPKGPEHRHYGVARAIETEIRPGPFTFVGIYGGCVLYRRTEA